MTQTTAKLGAYMLLSRLNVGGTAEVYLAAAPTPGGRKRLVAIKRILPELAGERDFARMLIDEARLACQLAHPGIARVVDLGKENGELFLAVEYVAGKDVADIGKRTRSRKQPLDTALACHIAIGLLDALGYAHAAKDASGQPMQLVHRDVSPSNVIVSWHGEVKVIDFGIARATNRLTKTQAGVLKGKFRYMSPEQASGANVDGRADVYAAAVVLHELLAGEKLFTGVSGFELIQKVIDGKTPTLRGRPGVSDELADMVARGLACVPAERWATAGEFADALRAYLAKAAPGRRLDVELASFMQETFAAEFQKEQEKAARLLAEAERLAAEEEEEDEIVHGERTMLYTGPPPSDPEPKPAPVRARKSPPPVPAPPKAQTPAPVRKPRPSTPPPLPSPDEDATVFRPQPEPKRAPARGTLRLVAAAAGVLAVLVVAAYLLM